MVWYEVKESLTEFSGGFMRLFASIVLSEKGKSTVNCVWQVGPRWPLGVGVPNKHEFQLGYGWYFTFVQGWVYIFLIYLQGFTPKQMVNPWKTYAKLSAVLMGSNGLTKGSLAFLNYPTQLMFKSTKVKKNLVAYFNGVAR
ncbi:Uncharacterized protein Fot_50248 [Forsythia ovata]|uniref:Uncharacterized protein n=1 Tax=Forsythia ovata TaxID=205694 RepID=A0ABD1PXN5_9LAMI